MTILPEESHPVPCSPAKSLFLIKRFKFGHAVLFLIHRNDGLKIFPEGGMNDPCVRSSINRRTVRVLQFSISAASGIDKSSFFIGKFFYRLRDIDTFLFVAIWCRLASEGSSHFC
jgi:hypothetical protein